MSKSTRRKSPQRREPQRAPTPLSRYPAGTQHHPLYGEIPLFKVKRGTAGHEYAIIEYDLDYQPEIPPGAVRGNPHKQHFCPMCNVPRFFYVDQERRCVECGRDFVFSAREQKHWYENLQFHFDSVAIRCLDCRRRQRTKKTLHSALALAKSKLAEKPDDAERALAVAQALVRLMEHTGEGDLEEAIALARKARRNDSPAAGLHARTLFWEGKAQALLGRDNLAAPLLQAAQEELPTNERGASLRAEAGWHLETIRERLR